MSLTLMIVSLLALAFAGFALWVRFAPSPPARWHVADPGSFPDPTTPNFARVDRIVPRPVAAIAQDIANAARAEGAVLLAGDETHGTWLVRSPIMRYPDYVSVKLSDAPAGSTRIEALSRSRFGYGDMGANRARLRRWIPQD